MPGAQHIIGQPASRWKIHAWHQCDASEPLQTFADRNAALLWLRQLEDDPGILTSLRSINAQYRTGSRLSNKSQHDILEELSWLLRSGAVHVHRVAPPATTGRVVEEVEAPAATRTVTPRRSDPVSIDSRPAKPVDEPDTFSSMTDAAATADVLRRAAESGTPFCEECAKAAARNAA